MSVTTVQAAIEMQPNLFTPFTNVSSEDLPVYTAAENVESLQALLNSKMAEYNESNVAINLVLFQQVSNSSSLSLTSCKGMCRDLQHILQQVLSMRGQAKSLSYLFRYSSKIIASLA